MLFIARFGWLKNLENLSLVAAVSLTLSIWVLLFLWGFFWVSLLQKSSGSHYLVWWIYMLLLPVGLVLWLYYSIFLYVLIYFFRNNLCFLFKNWITACLIRPLCFWQITLNGKEWWPVWYRIVVNLIQNDDQFDTDWWSVWYKMAITLIKNGDKFDTEWLSV